MKLKYHQVADWPPLAWLARCQAVSDDMHVWIGPGAEVRDNWFGEVVWAGEFADADFDKTDLVYGSGGRLRSDGVTFVSSATTVDRLHSMQRDEMTWVCNSLSCVAAAAQVGFDPAYSRYDEDFDTIVNGLEKYRRTFPTSGGPLKLTYFHNLHWNGQLLVEVNKPGISRDFSSFARYREFLVSSLQQIARNMSAGQRKHPFQMLGTIFVGVRLANRGRARPRGWSDGNRLVPNWS